MILDIGVIQRAFDSGPKFMGRSRRSLWLVLLVMLLEGLAILPSEADEATISRASAPPSPSNLESSSGSRRFDDARLHHRILHRGAEIPNTLWAGFVIGEKHWETGDLPGKILRSDAMLFLI